jgi:hypothetical protein
MWVSIQVPASVVSQKLGDKSFPSLFQQKHQMTKSKCQMAGGDQFNIQSIAYIHLNLGFGIRISMLRCRFGYHAATPILKTSFGTKHWIDPSKIEKPGSSITAVRLRCCRGIGLMQPYQVGGVQLHGSIFDTPDHGYFGVDGKWIFGAGGLGNG